MHVPTAVMHSWTELVLAGIALGIGMSATGWAGFVAVAELTPPRRKKSYGKDLLTIAVRLLLFILFSFGGTVFRPVVVSNAGNVIAAAACSHYSGLNVAPGFFIIRRLFLFLRCGLN